MINYPFMASSPRFEAACEDAGRDNGVAVCLMLQRAVQHLTKTLLDTAGVHGGLRVEGGDPSYLGDGALWTACLRMDVDGPGGPFAMLNPIGNLHGIVRFPADPTKGHLWSDSIAAVNVAVDAARDLDMPVAIRTGCKSMTILDRFATTLPGVLAPRGPTATFTAPLACRLA